MARLVFQGLARPQSWRHSFAPALSSLLSGAPTPLASSRGIMTAALLQRGAFSTAMRAVGRPPLVAAKLPPLGLPLLGAQPVRWASRGTALKRFKIRKMKNSIMIQRRPAGLHHLTGKHAPRTLQQRRRNTTVHPADRPRIMKLLNKSKGQGKKKPPERKPASKVRRRSVRHK